MGVQQLMGSRERVVARLEFRRIDQRLDEANGALVVKHLCGLGQESLSTGAEDLVVIVPLCVIALAVSKLLKALISILINVLDYAFPILLQLMRIPLFVGGVIGDGMEALLEGVVRCLPPSHAKRDAWRARVREHWI